MFRALFKTIHAQTSGLNLVIIIYKNIVTSKELMGELLGFEVLKFLRYDGGVDCTSYNFLCVSMLCLLSYMLYQSDILL